MLYCLYQSCQSCQWTFLKHCRVNKMDDILQNIHPTPPQPHPSPTLSLPPPTTSIPIPSSAYRACRSTCSPQWHHPVAEAAGGARVWGTTGSRRNHLTRSSRWLTRVMSRQLLLYVVCIYFVHDRDRLMTSGKVQWRPWESGDNRESLVTPWEKVPWWQGLWMWVSPPSLQLNHSDFVCEQRKMPSGWL